MFIYLEWNKTDFPASLIFKQAVAKMFIPSLPVAPKLEFLVTGVNLLFLEVLIVVFVFYGFVFQEEDLI